MTRIKICGITNLQDALLASELGADALGFIFYPESKRFIEPEQASEIISSLPPFVTTVGVFVNQSRDELDSLREITGIDLVQLHGDETPEFCTGLPFKAVKALRIKERSDIARVELYPLQAILFDKYSEDAYGGTGESFTWDWLQDLKANKSIILSGGLTPDNVGEAIKTVGPYAVDVSTGVEDSPGKKSAHKMRKFIEAVRFGS
jgi:phosphoribosylanthranilate isomerase